mgnify:FL=1
MIEYLVAFLIILMFINLFKKHKHDDINQSRLLHVRDQMSGWFNHMKDYSKQIDEHTKLILEQEKIFKRLQRDLSFLNIRNIEKDITYSFSPIDKNLDNKFPAMHIKKKPKFKIVKLKKERKNGNK